MSPRVLPLEEDGAGGGGWVPSIGHAANPGGICVTLGQRGSGVCSHNVLTDVLRSTWKRSKDADEELKAATAAFDAGNPGAAEHLQAAVDEAKVAWAARYMVDVVDMGHGYPQGGSTRPIRGKPSRPTPIRVGQRLTLPTCNRLVVSYKDSTCKPASSTFIRRGKAPQEGRTETTQQA